MWRRFRALFRRELTSWRAVLLSVCGLILLWDLYLATRLGKWEPNLVSSLTLVPLALVPVWALLASIQSWQREWQEGTIHLTMALPVPPWLIGAAKTASAATQMLLLGLFTGACAWPFWRGLIRQDRLPPVLWFRIEVLNGFKLGLLVLVMLLTLCVLAQLAYIVSRLVRRGTWLVAPLCMLTSLWASLRLATGLNALTESWLPRITLWSLPSFGRVLQLRAQSLSSAPLVSALLIACGATAVMGWIVGRQLDV